MKTASLAADLKNAYIELFELEKSNFQKDKLEEFYQNKIEYLKFKYHTLMRKNRLMNSELQKIKNMQKKERNEKKKLFQKKNRQIH